MLCSMGCVFKWLNFGRIGVVGFVTECWRQKHSKFAIFALPLFAACSGWNVTSFKREIVGIRLNQFTTDGRNRFVPPPHDSCHCSRNWMGCLCGKKDPLRFNVATCNWSCVDNWVILIFLLFFLTRTGRWEGSFRTRKNITIRTPKADFFFTKINVHWIIEWVELSNGVAPSNSWRWSVTRNLVCSMPKWEDGNRVWRMACCQPRCLETDPVESFRCLRFKAMILERFWTHFDSLFVY